VELGQGGVQTVEAAEVEHASGLSGQGRGDLGAQPSKGWIAVRRDSGKAIHGAALNNDDEPLVSIGRGEP
jgi:hypothetical protein